MMVRTKPDQGERWSAAVESGVEFVTLKIEKMIGVLVQHIMLLVKQKATL